MQELCKFSIKLNVISNRLEKYICFSFDNNLVFNDSFQFKSFSLDSLAKSLSKNDFKDLSQEFDSEVLDLVKQK